MENSPNNSVQPQQNTYASQLEPQNTEAARQPEVSENPDKNYVLAILFSYLFGLFAVDRFYLGYIGTGLLKLFTFGGFGIWIFIDKLRIVFGNLRAKDGRYLNGYAKYGKKAKIIAITLLVIELILIPLFVILIVFAAIPALQSTTRNTALELGASTVAAEIDRRVTENGGNYPTRADFDSLLQNPENFLGQDATWITNDMTYEPKPSNCDNISVTCTGYTLTVLPEGKEPLVLSGGK
jgi:TM2 domain-containing membrane protein YozV